MNTVTPLRRLGRKVLLVLACASLGACHFHGHCGGYHHHAPVRWCR